jgi:CMP-N-acetylneuraminic acid synthetase
MFRNYKILCTICARGGSKGIPGKNKKIISGKALIAYTIEVAKECNYIDDYIISTDDEDIIKISNKYNIPTPFKRPKYLCKSNVSRIDAVIHAVKWVEKKWKKNYDIIIDLSVTSPLRIVKDIKSAIELLINEKADNVFSVSPAYRNPYYNMVEDINGEIRKVKKLNEKITKRQDAPIVYDMNDSINVWWKNLLFNNKSNFNDNTKIYVMPRDRGIDIDDYFDLEIASLMLRFKNGEGTNV